MIAAAWLGCGGDEATGPGTWYAKDFAAPDGIELVFVPEENPDYTPILLRVEAGIWMLRQGERWPDASEVGSFEVAADGPLTIDGETVLSAEVPAGEVGAQEVWYGVFPEAVVAEVPAGRLSGDITLAIGIGPIRMLLDAFAWELAGYTPPDDQ